MIKKSRRPQQHCHRRSPASSSTALPSISTSPSTLTSTSTSSSALPIEMMNPAAIVPGLDGVRLPNGTRVVPTKHASRGGRAYPKEMREQVLEYYLHGGMDALESPTLNNLRHQNKFPHINTCKRWIAI